MPEDVLHFILRNHKYFCPPTFPPNFNSAIINLPVSITETTIYDKKNKIFVKFCFSAFQS